MSFEVRKFYADEASAYPSISSEVLAAMATQGVKTDADSTTAVPDIILAEPVKAEPAAEAAKPAAEAKPTEAPAVAEPAAPAAVPAVPTPSVTEAPAEIGIDWREQIKKVDASDILKELGYDDKMVGFFNKWRTDGNISEYLKAVTADFDKMTPEQLMRYQLEQSYPEFSPADIEELYQAKVIDAYKLDPNTFSEIEVRRGNLMLKADAKAVREALQKQQQEYVLSAKPPAPAVDHSAQEAEANREKLRAQYSGYLTGNQATKDLLTNRRLVMGDGEAAFNYEIGDPQRLLTILQEPQEYARHVFNEDGSPIVDKQLFIAAAALDHVGLANKLIKYGRDLGAKALVDQIENAKKPAGEISKGDTMPASPAEAMARFGVITSNS